MDLVRIAHRISGVRTAGITVGDFKEAIKTLQGIRNKKKASDVLETVAKGGVKTALKFLIGLAPGGGTVTSVLEAVGDMAGGDPINGIINGLFKKFRSTKDAVSDKDPIMSLFDIADPFTEILSKDIQDKFIKYAESEISTMSDSEELPDMNQMLVKYVGDNYDGYGVHEPLQVRHNNHYWLFL